jgi:hypothetical protein
MQKDSHTKHPGNPEHLPLLLLLLLFLLFFFLFFLLLPPFSLIYKVYVIISQLVLQ